MAVGVAVGVRVRSRASSRACSFFSSLFSQISRFAAAQLTLQELRAVLEQVRKHRHHLQRIEDPKFDTKYSFVG